MAITSLGPARPDASETSLAAGLPQIHSRIFLVVDRLLAQRSANLSLSLNTDLRDAGLSSIDMINLVLSVEEEFNITIPECEITPANLRSVSAVSALVHRLRG